MVVKLIGRDDTTVDGHLDSQTFSYDKFVCSQTGVCSQVRIKTGGNGNIKVAIYDNSGNRLAKKDADTVVSAGWNTIVLEAPCNLVNGVTYWLACNTWGSGLGYDSITSQRYWKNAQYSPFTFPDPIGSGFSSDTTKQHIMAGWGTSPETYDETGRLQVILVVQSRIDILNPDTYVETGRVQVILAEQSGVDNATFLDTGHAVVMSAVQGHSGLLIFLDTAHAQVVLVVQERTDAYVFVEGLEQVILAIQSSTDLATFLESLEQVVLTGQGSTDLATFLETTLEQVLLAIHGSDDLATFLETAKAQVILAEQGSTDLTTFLETALEQVLLIVDGYALAYVSVETGTLIPVLIRQGSWNNLIRLSLQQSRSGGPRIYPVKRYSVYGQKEG